MVLRVNRSSTVKLTGCSLLECGPHRTQSRSVHWSAGAGLYLALASSDATVRLWSIDVASGSAAAAKEVMSLTGHTGPVIACRFHPSAEAILCSASTDATVRLWDVRNATPKTTGKIDVSATTAAPIVSTQWNGVYAHILAVTCRDGTVAIYDTRMLSPTTTNKATALHTISLQPDVPETCVFDPTGNYLVAGTTRHRGEGMGSIRLQHWKKPVDDDGPGKFYSYPAHAGPVYAMAFAADGQRLATGGSDALVSLWDVATMCCCSTITSRTKFIRSVEFSHDSKLLAIATEEDAVDLIETETGASIGLASLGVRPRSAGAEDVAFHPVSKYLLACARTDTAAVMPAAPVSIAKLIVSPA